jgi:chromosome segregation ATPase
MDELKEEKNDAEQKENAIQQKIDVLNHEKADMQKQMDKLYHEKIEMQQQME